MYFRGKKLKTLGGIQFIHNGRLVIFHYRIVIPEPEINKPALVFFCLIDIRTHHLEVILNGIYLPDNVITQAKHIDRLIQTGHPGAYPPI
jgi:hypothetical protein